MKFRGTDRTERTTLFEGDDIDVTDGHTAQALDEFERLEEYLDRPVYHRLERALAVHDHTPDELPPPRMNCNPNG